MTASVPPQPQPVALPTVLFAIGNEPVRRLLAEVLIQTALPYAHHIVATLEEARQWLAHATPACVVATVDVALGVGAEGDGLLAVLPATVPLVSLLKRSRDFPMFPAYLYQQPRWRDFVTMPFALDELLARIESVMSRAPASQQSSGADNPAKPTLGCHGNP